MLSRSSKLLILASASPARKRLLNMAGMNPVICPSDFDESQIQTDHPIDLVQTLARCKAETVAERLVSHLIDGIQPESALILGCDSVLVIDGEVHGKPADKLEALTRWQKMRGQIGQLFTGHTLIDIEQSKTLTCCQITKVYFANLSDQQIAAYVETGEPLNCAGGFAIEGKGGLFVEKIEGCHTNVIGLSLPLLREMLQTLNYESTHFWQS
ncbi:MAG: nucleoside triphosphate pyrophosphatase [Microcoleaceae cyanobacterium]